MDIVSISSIKSLLDVDTNWHYSVPIATIGGLNTYSYLQTVHSLLSGLLMLDNSGDNVNGR